MTDTQSYDLFDEVRLSPNRNGMARTLWQIAEVLRPHMEVSQYKHYVLALLFLRFLSDQPSSVESDTAQQIARRKQKNTTRRAVRAYNLPKEAQWSSLGEAWERPDIGSRIDRAIKEIVKANPSLKDTLPNDFSRTELKGHHLGRVVRLISQLQSQDSTPKGEDLLGRAYEYFLSEFARQEGSKGGQFYTPRSVVRLLVNLIRPLTGVVYDPCCGSGGMFVQSEEFLEAHGGKPGDLNVVGQESNLASWRLAKMNLLAHGLNFDLGETATDTFLKDQHPTLRADYVLANPPFNMKGWGGSDLRDDPRWLYGLPADMNANYAWLQHILAHLADHGTAGVVLANGSLSTNVAGDGAIRRALVDADVVDCIVSLPNQLFFSTQIPVSLWILNKDKAAATANSKRKLARPRQGHVLMIDVRSFGHLVDRTQRDLTDAEIEEIASTYARWSSIGKDHYKDVPGFCFDATIEQIHAHKCALVPGRYVGFANSPDSEFMTAEIRQELATLRETVMKLSTSKDKCIRIIDEVIHG